MKDYLNNYGIYDLREIARRVGVKVPTSKRKAQLITEIVEGDYVKFGIIEKGQKTVRGRPPMKNFNADNFFCKNNNVDVYIKENLIEILKISKELNVKITNFIDLIK